MDTPLTFDETRARIHKRNRLPHISCPGAIQFVTFCLADAIPVQVRIAIDEEIDTMREHLLKERRTLTFQDIQRLRLVRQRMIERTLDKGHGACLLARPGAAKVVFDALCHFDGLRYEMLSNSVMPNHVHTTFVQFEGFPIESVLFSWKSFTSKQVNRVLGRKGKLWLDDYFDTVIRTKERLERTMRYVANNPAKAGLKDWPWIYSREIQF